MTTKIEVEYCGSCGHLKQFEELSQQVKEKLPNTEVQGKEGRRGSFEVIINDTLVHSKLQTLAFPDYSDVVEIAREANEGKPVRKVAKQQPINCCIS